MNAANCRWCNLEFIPIAHHRGVPVYCSDACRKARRRAYDSAKGKRYYAAHRDERLPRLLLNYYNRTAEQTRRYNEKALLRYHAKQDALKRSKVFKEKLRAIP